MYKSNHISLCVGIYSIDVRHVGIDYGYPQGHAHKHCKKLQTMQKNCKIMMFFSTYLTCSAILMLRGSVPLVRVKIFA